jgi:hypothetical protein
MLAPRGTRNLRRCPRALLTVYIPVLRMTTPSVRFRAEVCGVPAGAYSVYGPPGNARIPPKDGARDAR